VVEEEGTEKGNVQGAAGVNTMPLAVIIDDRVEVWAPGHEQQIVKANQFSHYENTAKAVHRKSPTTSVLGNNEMTRICNFLKGIRQDQRFFWEDALCPTVAVLMEEGIPNAFWALEMHQIMAAMPYVNVNGHAPARPLPSSAQAQPLNSRCAAYRSQVYIVWFSCQLCLAPAEVP
jgi:hypothetical protein